jgi:hypothetical protein
LKAGSWKLEVVVEGGMPGNHQRCHDELGRCVGEGARARASREEERNDKMAERRCEAKEKEMDEDMEKDKDNDERMEMR